MRPALQILACVALVFFIGIVLISNYRNRLIHPSPAINSIIINDHPSDTNISSFERTSAPEYVNKPFSYISSTPLSKDLVVNSAYFDNRPRSGHSNVTVFFIVANKTIFLSNWIIGCGVGTTETTDFIVRYVYEDILMHQVYGENVKKYELLAVECYNLRAVSGERAFIIYKTSENVAKGIVVESERPLMIPAPRIQPTGQYDFTLTVCTKVHNRGAPWLPEFIRYQKTIGVDHVHMSILENFIKDGGLASLVGKYPFVREAIHSGYLTISTWKEWHDIKEAYDHSTILQYLDCFYRFRGTYDYISPMDTDDFFTPRIPGKTQLKHYIKEFCYEKPAASCVFQWLWLFPDVCGIGEVGEDGNVTKAVKSQKLSDNYHNMKSVHSTQGVVDFSYHSAKCSHCLMPGWKVVHVPPLKAYVTHNRKYMHEKKEKVC